MFAFMRRAQARSVPEGGWQRALQFEEIPRIPSQASVNFTDRRDRGPGLARRLYAPRVLGALLAGLALFGSMKSNPQTPEALWVVCAFNVFIWPHLAFRLALGSSRPHRAERRNLVVDCFVGGFWAAAIGFDLLPSALVLVMPIVDNVAVGGARLLRLGLAAQAVGIAVAIAVFGWHPAPATSMLTVVMCLPFLVAYPLVIAVVAYQLALKLSMAGEALRALTELDGLTGLANRRAFDVRLGAIFSSAGQTREPATLVMIDIDHFKKVNDVHGHVVGDEVIRHVARALQAQVRRGDLAARYGGEEFSLLLTGIDAQGALRIVERVRLALERDPPPAMAPQRVTVSAGVAEWERGLSNVEGWVGRADKALYAAKRNGRDRVELWNEAQG